MTLGLAVAVVVVAMAARAPLSRSTPVDAQAAQGPTVALFMVLAGVGIVMLGTVAAMAWFGRRRKNDLPSPEPRRIDIPWFWKLAVTLLTFALGAALVVGALLGTRSLHQASRFASPAFGIGSLRRGPRSGASNGFVVPSWLSWTLLGLVVIAIAACAATALWLRRARRRTDSQAADAIATREAVGAAIGALGAEGDPRRAVIAAYGAMQRTLGDHGVVRSPAEAPREYLNRVLLASRATEREVTTLTRLFEEARYSVHPIPERMREAALAALRALQRGLRAEGAG